MSQQTPSLSLALLRIDAVRALCGLSRSAIYRGASEGTFPRPVRVGARGAAWVESEVLDWNRARIAERDNTQGKHAARKAQLTDSQSAGQVAARNRRRRRAG